MLWSGEARKEELIDCDGKSYHRGDIKTEGHPQLAINRLLYLDTALKASEEWRFPDDIRDSPAFLVCVQLAQFDDYKTNR